MTQPYKQCPQCQTPAPLQAPICSSCGRQYRTQFNANQTQVIPAQPMPPPGPTPTQQFGVHRSTLPSYGPRDEAEWMASCFWFWVWLWFSSYLATCCVIVLIHAVDAEVNNQRNGMVGGSLVLAFGFATWATFCAMRLRRLYVYFSAKRRLWYINAASVVLLVCGGAYEFNHLLWPPPKPVVVDNRPIEVGPQVMPSFPVAPEGPRHSDIQFGNNAPVTNPPIYTPPVRTAPTYPGYRTFSSGSGVGSSAPPAQPTIIDHGQRPTSGFGGGGFGGGGFGGGRLPGGGTSNRGGGLGSGGGGFSGGFR